MPTILDICGLEVPDHVEGASLWSGKERDLVYGEAGEGAKATRMIRSGRYKLIYYPSGNVAQLFDIENDPKELHNIAAEQPEIRQRLEHDLMRHLYGKDMDWMTNGKLTGLPAPEYSRKPDYGLYNQRGLHWPPPSGYSNIGKNA